MSTHLAIQGGAHSVGWVEDSSRGPNEVYQCGIPGDAMVRSLTQLQVPWMKVVESRYFMVLYFLAYPPVFLRQVRVSRFEQRCHCNSFSASSGRCGLCRVALDPVAAWHDATNRRCFKS
jgi:hypothetical protein